MSSPDPGVAGLAAMSSRTGRIVVSTAVLGSAVAQLTATVVNVALPTLATDLGAGSAQQQWIVNAYLVTLASLVLICGSFGDRWGRVRVFRIGVAWFAVASLLCALAPSSGWLIAARLLQGVGGALLTPGSLAIIEATLRPDDRGRAVGAWSGLGGVAGAIGPLVGGLLVDASWRWAFVVNVPIAAAALVTSRWVPESRDPTAGELPLDWVGAALSVVVLGGASYALIDSSGSGSALVAPVVAVVVLGVVGLVVWERGRPNAILPVDLFADRQFIAANLVTFLVYGGMGTVFFLLSIQLQVTAGWTPLAAGASLLPVTLLMLLFSARAGAWAARVGPRLPLTLGPLVIAAGMLLMTRIDADATFVADVLPAALVFGAGLALTVAPVTSAALGSVPDSRAGAASGTNNAVARTGHLLVVAAVPTLVGLGGDGLSDPAALESGFPLAVTVGAGLVGAGAVISAVMFRRRDTCRDLQPSPDEPVFLCGVDGPPLAEQSVR